MLPSSLLQQMMVTLDDFKVLSMRQKLNAWGRLSCRDWCAGVQPQFRTRTALTDLVKMTSFSRFKGV